MNQFYNLEIRAEFFKKFWDSLEPEFCVIQFGKSKKKKKKEKDREIDISRQSEHFMNKFDLNQIDPKSNFKISLISSTQWSTGYFWIQQGIFENLLLKNQYFMHSPPPRVSFVSAKSYRKVLICLTFLSTSSNGFRFFFYLTYALQSYWQKTVHFPHFILSTSNGKQQKLDQTSKLVLCSKSQKDSSISHIEFKQDIKVLPKNLRSLLK